MANTRRQIILSSMGLAVIGGSTKAWAQAFPSRPVTIIIPWPAGGALDAVVRMIQPAMSASLGQSVVLDNRSGANGIVGTTAVARASADGHTLVATIEAHIINPSLYKNIAYDPIRDFEPISTVMTTSNLLAAHPSFPANDLQGLLRYARQRTEPLPYASVGAGSQQHLLGALFANQAGISMQHVAYRGGAPAINDLVAGHVPLAYLSATSTLPLLRAGKVKVIGSASPERLKEIPDVGTFSEAGFGSISGLSWIGFLAPKNTPREAVEKIYGALAAAVQTPAVQEKLASLGAQPRMSANPAAFRSMLTADVAKYDAIVKANGISLE